MSKEIIIGRSTEDCDIVISGDMTVSRIHCSVELLWNGKYRLTDLKSRNGTFYNGEKINVCDLNAFDVFQVGKQLIYGNGQLVDKLQNAAIEVVDITKSYDGLRHVVQKTSFAIKNGSLTAIMGPSGCGKSTLLKLLNGMIPPTAGDVKVFGIDLKTSFNNIKNKIGYVPQDDTIHLELTVYQSLYFAAKLRLKGYTNSEIEKRINELLQKLNISAIKQKRNSEISGGQRKRVCIAIELLSNPLVLLLDEPTSPLDPQTISEFMSILKLLASDETTVILVTHKPEDLDFMDEVIFLNVAGATRFKGSPLGCLNAFNATNYTEIYKILSEEVSEKQSHLKVKGNVVYTDPTEYLSKSKVRWFNQFFWLTNRNLRVKTNDLYNTLILFVQAPIIAILVGLVFDELSLAVIFMTVISGIWFGVNNSAREIVKEKNIFRREYNFNLRISSYLFSKIITLLIIGVLQSILFTLTLYLFYDGKIVSINSFLFTLFWLVFVTAVSSVFGLVISAAMNNTEKVMSLIPIVLIPQIMLAGMLANISNVFVEIVSYFTLSRWGTEGLTVIQDDIITVRTSADGSSNKIVTDAHNFLKGNFHDTYDQIFNSYAGSIYLDTFVLSTFALTFILGAYIILRKKYSIT